MDSQSYQLPHDLDAKVNATLEDWRAGGKVHRLWAGDKTLWTGQDEDRWLGWLRVVEDRLAHVGDLREVAEEIKRAGFSHALLLGMGGSSLCAEVMATTFGKISGFPELRALDSTDPAQIKRFEEKLDLAKTLFIVSSKSGTTLEPNILKQYFFERAKEQVGAEEAGRRFIAITDPESKLQQQAEKDGFRRIFFGLPSIGGRYSALSNFGMVSSAIMGVDVAQFLDRAKEMARGCGPSVPPEENPGVVLGAIMGVLANLGRDKITIIPSPGIRDFGAWLEQLLAESTGKAGKGLIPIHEEKLGSPGMYGDDRLFVYIRLESKPNSTQDDAVEALEQAGNPVVRIAVRDLYDLGGEFFRWEMATAVAGAVIGINPFDQPDVEESKIAARKLTAEFEKTGTLAPERPLFEDRGVKLFTDQANAAALSDTRSVNKNLVSFLKAHLNRVRAGDYFSILAYVDSNERHHTMLQEMRHLVRDGKKVATSLGYGPRFLHSTGQLYKGGPNNGVFLQITCDDAADLPVPGQKYTFGIVKAAQARGDFEVLAQRGRRALRAHLGSDVGAGLAVLRAAIQEAIA
ncbi:MAG TPA: bifunctional transaldolase/phosoglucose isomerase [Candidatus Binatia bacterium]|nr:bifunctional transaldolase/phosoglucose isomerase [Candidatus Binatia bacterium]